MKIFNNDFFNERKPNLKYLLLFCGLILPSAIILVFVMIYIGIFIPKLFFGLLLFGYLYCIYWFYTNGYIFVKESKDDARSS